jgi:dihydroorotase
MTSTSTTSNTILIKNGRVIDPSQGIDRVTNVLIQDGKVAGLDVNEESAKQAAADGNLTVVDASNKIVSPGLIDLHAELREPGFEEDETIESGTAAAIQGGYTSIGCVANTDPPIDTQASVEYVRQKAVRANNCNVFVIACVSKNRDGEQLAEIGTLVEAGAVAFSDASHPIQNSNLLRRALEYCLMFDKVILSNPEDVSLNCDGVMHEGLTAMVLGLAGMTSKGEDVMTSRDLRLAEATGGRLHLMNISSAGSVELIRRARTLGLEVTAEVCPANFILTDVTLRTFDSNYKVNPPLRSQDHVDACIAGLIDGTLDVIASCHRPRATEKKMQELDLAPFGMSALETTLSLVVEHLVNPGHLTWTQVIEKMTINPARILGIQKGSLKVGADADVTIIDPQAEWTLEAAGMESRSANTPFIGHQMRGRAVQVIVGGEFKLGEPQTSSEGASCHS